MTMCAGDRFLCTFSVYAQTYNWAMTVEQPNHQLALAQGNQAPKWSCKVRVEDSGEDSPDMNEKQQSASSVQFRPEHVYIDCTSKSNQLHKDCEKKQLQFEQRKDITSRSEMVKAELYSCILEY